jgi:riboflavin kinase/FMN adenylyltransferase
VIWKQAARLLGRPYDMCGRVAHGDQIASHYRFSDSQYSSASPGDAGLWRLRRADQRPHLQPWPGVANVGRRPTVRGIRQQLEVHLLDFKGDLYGQQVKVDFLHYIRPEQRFESLDACKPRFSGIRRKPGNISPRGYRDS